MIELNLALLADNAHMDASGKLYILGEFRYIFAAQLPARHGQFSIVARWEASAAEVRGQENTLELEIVDADGRAIMPRSPKFPLAFGPIGDAGRGRVEARLIVGMQGMVLTNYGDHVFQFFVNGIANGTAKFYVASAPAKGLVAGG